WPRSPLGYTSRFEIHVIAVCFRHETKNSAIGTSVGCGIFNGDLRSLAGIYVARLCFQCPNGCCAVSSSRSVEKIYPRNQVLTSWLPELVLRPQQIKATVPRNHSLCTLRRERGTRLTT